MTKDEALAFDLALEALEETLKTLDDANAIPGGPIADTIWYSPYETLFDYLEVKIAAIKQARALDKKAENARELGLDYEPAEVLGHNGWGLPIKSAAPVQKKCDCAAHSAADCVCGAWDKSAVAPVREDWGPGPHECHSLTAAPVQDELAYRAAVSLATGLFKKHFAHEEHYASGRVVWEPCDTTAGVISQIDNMVCGLVQPAATVKESLTVQPAAPVQEPVAWRYRGILHEFDPSDWAEGLVTPLYATPPAQPAPVPEPVAFFDPQGKGFYWAKPTKITAPVTVDVEPLPLYTTPPEAQRQWVSLTDDEVEKACVPLGAAMLSFTEVARAIEAKLKEKNT